MPQVAAVELGDAIENFDIAPLWLLLLAIGPYFPLIVVFAARYDRRSGIGTVIALMLPYFAAMAVIWTAFFAAWYLPGLPWGLVG
ncbi:MAG: AbgT family transporter [Candidatus Nanopelagicales bacterium]